jgi:hypothetical protein
MMALRRTAFVVGARRWPRRRMQQSGDRRIRSAHSATLIAAGVGECPGDRAVWAIGAARGLARLRSWPARLRPQHRGPVAAQEATQAPLRTLGKARGPAARRALPLQWRMPATSPSLTRRRQAALTGRRRTKKR